MSTPPSRHSRTRVDAGLAFLLLLAVCGVAQARKSDRNQPIHVSANAFRGSQASGKITFTGDVKINQGSFHADGDKAVGYTDPKASNQLQRVVLTGDPAHFQQTQDDGALVHGSSQTLDYMASQNTIILIGKATLVQQGRGQFHGARLVYDTASGRIEGTAAAGGRVHITLQPRSPPAPGKPRAKGTGSPSRQPPTPPASMPDAPASGAAPATTGTH